jgi:hypothetical protein
MIETTESSVIDKSVYYQNEYSNCSNSNSVASNDQIHNDSTLSLNSTTRSNDSSIEQQQHQRSCNEELSAFIKHYFSSSNKNQIIPPQQQEKPKKSFLICDILGLNYDEENKTSNESNNKIDSSKFNSIDEVSTAASNFLLNFNYSSLVTNLNKNTSSNIKRNNKRSGDEYEQENLKSIEITTTKKATASVSSSKKLKLDDKIKSEKQVNTKPIIPSLFPAWVYCTRYSDRPSAGLIKFHFKFLYFNIRILIKRIIKNH